MTVPTQLDADPDDGGFLCGGQEDDPPAVDIEPTAPAAPVHYVRDASRPIGRRSRTQCGTYRVGYGDRVAPVTDDHTRVTCRRCRRTGAYKTAVLLAQLAERNAAGEE